MIHVDFPYGFDKQGRTSTTTWPNHVRDLVEQTLFTSPGERVNRPDFGCGLLQMVFEPIAAETSAAIETTVFGSLQRWLGDIIEVRGVEAETEDSTIRVSIAYRLLRTGEHVVEEFREKRGMTTKPDVEPRILEHCCADDKHRRRETRSRGLTGIDYVEIGEHAGALVLEVTFIGSVPEEVGYRVRGGRRVTDLLVGSPTVRASDLHGGDDIVRLPVGAVGDSSVYTLWLTQLDEHGHATGDPPPDIDPRYASATFRFRTGGPAVEDCRGCEDERCCPADRPSGDDPDPIELDYLAKDYASFRRLSLDRLAVTMPKWVDREVPDVAITLVEMLSYVGDHLSYHQDAVATEAYLNTARQRISVARHLRLLDYKLHEGTNARSWVVIQTDVEREVSTLRFETDEPVRCFAPVPGPVNLVSVKPERNEFKLYTWGGSECHLPEGSRAASLVWDHEPSSPSPEPAYEPTPYDEPPASYEQAPQDQPTYEQTPPTYEQPPPDQQYEQPPATYERPPDEQKPRTPPGHGSGRPPLPLEPGDRLLLKEVASPRTGEEADADPTRRHVVRLETVELIEDPVSGVWVLYVTWCEGDALPFDLCLEAPIPPDCEIKPCLAIACGNVVLADHGKEECEPLDPPVVVPPDHECLPGCCPDPTVELEPYHPELDVDDLTMAGDVKDTCPSADLLVHDPTTASPALTVRQQIDDEVLVWTTVADLIESGPADRHVVVEVGNDGRPRLRFGDGTNGVAPLPGVPAEVCYRRGNGPDGNVGADTIVRVFAGDDLLEGVSVTNPLPATGGTEPEDVDRARLLGPTSARRRPARAVTPDDYVALVMYHFGSSIQRAHASRRFDGVGTEIFVAVDPIGRHDLAPGLGEEIEAMLARFRVVNHTVVVAAARHAPLEILVEAEAEPWAVARAVRTSLARVLGSGHDAAGQRALFHPDERTFGQPIYFSRILSRLLWVDGVADITRVAVGRLGSKPYDLLLELRRAKQPLPAADEEPALEPAAEEPNGPHVAPEADPRRKVAQRFAARLDLCADEIARLDNDPDDPASGVARIRVTGGR